jgi:hypothetical protein
MPFPYLENLRRAVTGSDPAATGPAMAPGDGLLKASNILIRDRILGDGRSQLIFDAAGLPPERRRWHSHQDDLQVLLSLDGRPIWIDPGRFTYTQEYRFRLPGTGKPVYPRGRLGFLYRLSGARTRDLAGRDWRRYFQSRSAHNVWHCLDPEGRERPLATGNIQPLACTRTDGLRLAATALRDEDGYEHIRWIVEIGTETLLLVDGARSPHPTPWAGHFLFPDDIVLEEGEGQFVIRDGQRGPLLVQTIREVGARGLEVRVTRGWFSPCYNEKRPAPVLHLESPPVAEWVVMTAVCRPGVTGRILQELNAEFEGSDLIIVGRAAAGSLPVRIPDFWAAGG